MEDKTEFEPTIKAYDPKLKKWYTWSWGHMGFYPDNLLELIKEEGLILEKDFDKSL